MSRLQIPIRLIALFLTILAGCQQDFTAEVTILGINPSIKSFIVYMWRDRHLSDGQPPRIPVGQSNFKIRVPISAYTKRIEMVVLALDVDDKLRMQGYTTFDADLHPNALPQSIQLRDAAAVKSSEELFCPDAKDNMDAPCSIHTADAGVHWRLGSDSIDRSLTHSRWYVWREKDGPRLRAMDNLGANYAVAVGEQGAVIRCIGSQCSRLTTETTHTLCGVYVKDERESIAVGDEGTKVNCIEGNCTIEDLHIKKRLCGVLAGKGDTFSVVGDQGTILRCDKTTCSSITENVPKENLNRMWGPDPDHFWAVGDGGTVLWCNDQACKAVPSRTRNKLTGVWGRDSTSVFVVGEKGTLLACDEFGCRPPSVPETKVDLKSIHGSDPNNVIVSGVGDTTLQWDGHTWTKTRDGSPLSELVFTAGSWKLSLTPSRKVFSLEVPRWAAEIQITATASDYAKIAINGVATDSGVSSSPISLKKGVSVVSITVQERDADPYEITVAITRSSSDYLKASNTEAGDLFGYSVSLSGDTLAVGAYGEAGSATGVHNDPEVQYDNNADMSGAVYVFARSNGVWTQQAYLKASNTEKGDWFGYSVSLSGDTLAVGAYREDSSATGVNRNDTDNNALASGAVYVFVRSGGVWTQQAYLKASNTRAGYHFGESLSLSADTLVIGAHREASNATGIGGDESNVSASESGAVYVFVRSGGIWSQQAYLKASNTEAADQFGYSVSLSGDTLAVGAHGEDSSTKGVNKKEEQNDNNAPSSGAVYIFVRSGGVWTQQAYLKASNTDAGDYFGYSVSLSGDTLAVGAYGEASIAKGVNGSQADNNALQSGAVYVFALSNGVWTQQAYLKASNAEKDDWFGYSVSLFGDTLAVGANKEASIAKGVNGNQSANNALQSGAVYVFARSNGVWTQQSYLKASNTDVWDSFGYSVSLSGDTLAVGAPWEDSRAKGVNGSQDDDNAFNSGAVYVF
jgi:hypothetical protein